MHAAAAAKSLQSCLTLCNPIDSSLPGSPVPGILLARILEWVAISFSLFYAYISIYIYIYIYIYISSKKEKLYTATLVFFVTNSEILGSKGTLILFH